MSYVYEIDHRMINKIVFAALTQVIHCIRLYSTLRYPVSLGNKSKRLANYIEILTKNLIYSV